MEIPISTYERYSFRTSPIISPSQVIWLFEGCATAPQDGGFQFHLLVVPLLMCCFSIFSPSEVIR